MQPLIYSYRSLVSGMAIAVTLAASNALKPRPPSPQSPPMKAVPWPPAMLHLGHSLAQEITPRLTSLAIAPPAALPLVLLPWRLRYPQHACDRLLQTLSHAYEPAALAAVWVVHEYLRQHLSQASLSSPAFAVPNITRGLDRAPPVAISAPIADLRHCLTTSAAYCRLSPLLQPLALALHYLDSSGGDYRLAMGRGLEANDTVATCGLIGLLATATAGLSIIPLSWRLAMTSSRSTISPLQRIWGCRETDLWQLAESLLASWAGVRMTQLPPDPDSNIPVMGMPYL
ncbi:hypothetical protein XM38_003150 [Halomicronema hongdechloris C2206]|uniref:Uncharacterized protein n=1 Tax=Halomicronema hongdechloris C2206 TaxID=1641165 RepID=A0A1Z3HGM3_9CYAN|nr:hypothetical protein [Halomicronema hongdechloris]ASC69388.1 hypothetical protein XM38_003150 [Halomicronema hongdechloris C2206]